jgi:hypothetical protein
MEHVKIQRKDQFIAGPCRIAGHGRDESGFSVNTIQREVVYFPDITIPPLSTNRDIAIVEISHILGTTLDFVGFGLLHGHQPRQATHLALSLFDTRELSP